MNNPGELILPVVAYLARQLPELLALLAGMIVALVCWRRSGRTAVLALVAFVLAFVGLLVNVGTVLLSLWLQTGAGLSALATELITNAINFVVNLLPAVAWLLIIMALFGRKKEQLPTKG